MKENSGLLESRNDDLIEELLEDPNFKITKEGLIFSKLTRNGQGISDKWRQVGYRKKDGYVRFRYKGEFLFAHRVVYRKWKGPLEKGKVINHINLKNWDNHPDNLEMVTQHTNNNKKHKKYKKHKKADIIRKVMAKLGAPMTLKDIVKRRMAKLAWFGTHEKRDLKEGEWEKLDNGNQRTYLDGWLLIVNPQHRGTIKDGANKIVFDDKASSEKAIKDLLIKQVKSRDFLNKS